jgi:hypothetical protein
VIAAGPARTCPAETVAPQEMVFLPEPPEVKSKSALTFCAMRGQSVFAYGRGVLPLPISALNSARPVLGNPTN